MRRTILPFLLATCLLGADLPGRAEPVLHGHRLPQSLPGKAGVATPSDKGVILAHVFNGDASPLNGGAYEIGLELQGKGKPRTFVVKPTSSIGAGELRTFRLQIPKADLERYATFRIFTRMGGKATYSDLFSLTGQPTRPVEVTTLYTEAPPDPDSMVPPTEVPFEDETLGAFEVHSPAVPAKPAASKSGAKPATATAASAKASATPAAPTKGPTPISGTAATSVAATTGAAVAAPTETPARTIGPAEFKTLRTIDEELVIYVIKKGDTLRQVAARYYGDASQERKIMELNFIDNPASVRVGEEIIVDVRPIGKTGPSSLTGASSAVGAATAPAKSAGSAKTTAVSAPSPAAVAPAAGAACATGGQTYVIQSGDTLEKIAKRFYGKGTKAGLILQANPCLNPRNLKIGTTIVIPAGKGNEA
ncbi:MAG: putative lysozyme [Candidatus Ozemobacter sibiricus]|jgi:nucleoid-associated protein YgaU|uniref:Putative lysozyme n=1 Tax=Candidatus Ozemobacter sibiricus TaxID=2268124 RepID=A0A367ZTV1_9BACT|nr:MAG: putative lysozyme [Candidatus Ozemobacter sibiricus]